jgi:hypothetical protein
VRGPLFRKHNKYLITRADGERLCFDLATLGTTEDNHISTRFVKMVLPLDRFRYLPKSLSLLEVSACFP